MPDMSQLLSGWTPTPEHPYMVLDAPAGQAVQLALNVEPGPANPDKQLLLLQAVNDRWSEGAPPRDWLLWELKISSNGSAVIERDGRGPRQRELEPWKSANWTGKPASGIKAAITFDPLNGSLLLVVDGRPTIAGPIAMRTPDPWKLIVGRVPWYRDLADPVGWSLDLAWSAGADAPPPVVTPPTPTVVTPPGTASELRRSMHWEAMLALSANSGMNALSQDEIAKEAALLIQAHEYHWSGGKP